jgi:hypothetical protein
MFNIFKITGVGGPNSKTIGQDLLGLLIIQVDRICYVVAPEQDPHKPATIVTHSKLSGQQIFFSFQYKRFDGPLDGTVSGLKMSGTWGIGNQGGDLGRDVEGDTWTASGTTTTTTGDGDDEARAASGR